MSGALICVSVVLLVAIIGNGVLVDPALVGSIKFGGTRTPHQWNSGVWRHPVYDVVMVLERVYGQLDTCVELTTCRVDSSQRPSPATRSWWWWWCIKSMKLIQLLILTRDSCGLVLIVCSIHTWVSSSVFRQLFYHEVRSSLHRRHSSLSTCSFSFFHANPSPFWSKSIFQGLPLGSVLLIFPTMTVLSNESWRKMCPLQGFCLCLKVVISNHISWDIAIISSLL